MPTDAIAAFAATPRPIILRYFNRGSCIASSRIAIEVLGHFGVRARPLAVRFVVRAPSLQMVFIAGLPGDEKLKAQREARAFVELQPGPEIRGGGGSGWNGHLIVHAEGCLVDASFDQALDAIAQSGARIDASPRVAIFPLNGRPLPDYFEARFTAVLDDNTQIHVEYVRLADDSFQQAPAWETDHLEPAIAGIIDSMEELLERAA